MRPPKSDAYLFVMAEINDTHAVLDRFGVPRTYAGEKLSLAQRAGWLEKAAVAARIAALATKRAKKYAEDRSFKEFY